MAERVVLAGATGYLGRYLAQALSMSGYEVRAIVRSRTRAEQPGPFGAPPLTDYVAEWLEGTITEPEFVRGACRGADRVVSALGVTRQKASPWDVDYRANLALLADAEREGLKSFLYVGVMNAALGSSLIMRSKAAFTEVLTRSDLHHQVVNPSGYFSDLTAMFNMARKGISLLPPGGLRLAPIHGADLASFCVGHVGDRNGSWEVGGPDIVTYREIAELASAALGRRPRTITIPRGALRTIVWIARHAGDRPADLAQFFADGVARDAVGERFGSHHLKDHFKELAG